MKVKELIKFLRRFSKADFLIDGQDIHFEIYEDQSGRLVVDLKLPKKKMKKVLTKRKKYNIINI
jgi:hypothetical protein